MSELLATRIQLARKRYELLEANLARLDAMLQTEIPELVRRLRAELVDTQRQLMGLEAGEAKDAYSKFVAALSASKAFKDDSEKIEFFFRICALLRDSDDLRNSEIRKRLSFRHTGSPVGRYLQVLREAKLVEKISDQVKANIPHRLTKKGHDLMMAFDTQEAN